MLRLGTRKSELALAQSGQVARALEAAHPGLRVELVPIVTRGDLHRGPLAPVGGKGLFTEELESGLLSGELDLAVHSLKDLPVDLTPGLEVAAYPERVDPRDVLISVHGGDFADLPRAGVVLTGSLRRGSQVCSLAPHLEVQGLRGNVGTRIRRWQESGAAGVILAAAGLARLGLDQAGVAEGGDLPLHPLDPETFIPAPGQGTLAIETRQGSRASELCRALHHEPTALCSRAERYLVAAFGADCTLPLAAWARWNPDSGRLSLIGLVATPDGRQVARGEAFGDDPDTVGEACARALRSSGADEILARLPKARKEPAASAAGTAAGESSHS